MKNSPLRRTVQNLKNIGSNVRYFVRGHILGKWNGVAGHEYINKPMTDKQFEDLSSSLYGNDYIMDHNYNCENIQIQDKERVVDLVLTMLPDLKSVCDAGANRGYLMKVFKDRGLDVYGFDIMEDKSLVLDDVKASYTIGSILNIPNLGFELGEVECVISVNVFEHIPINKTDRMIAELKKLNPLFMVIGISKDMISPGHITLKRTNWWIKKFEPEYRVMKELKTKFKEYERNRFPKYCDTGCPRNGFNKCPGIIFLKRAE